jgi:hypothetical protein
LEPNLPVLKRITLLAYLCHTEAAEVLLRAYVIMADVSRHIVIGETPDLKKLMAEHAARQVVHADTFGRVAPEAEYAQEAHFRSLAKQYEERRREAAEDASLVEAAFSPGEEKLVRAALGENGETGWTS